MSSQIRWWGFTNDSLTQIARFTGPTWSPPGSCLPQMGPMLAPWTLLPGNVVSYLVSSNRPWSHRCKNRVEKVWPHGNRRAFLFNWIDWRDYFCLWMDKITVTCKTVWTADLAKYGTHKTLFWCWMVNCFLGRPLNMIKSKCSYTAPSHRGTPSDEFMMTSSNGNIFRVTGPLCGKFAGHR